jgi:hypothetical protein
MRPRGLMAAGAVLLILLSGCLGSDTADEPPAKKAANTRECAPRQKAVSVRSLDPDAIGWAFGKAPVYVSFLDTPMYRAARRGPGSFVAIYRDSKRNGLYGTKLMTIVHPTFAGKIRQEVSAVTPGGKTAFSLGVGGNSLGIDRLPKTQELDVTAEQDRVPGGLVFTGPGCYRLKVEAQGESYELAFPVRFARTT